MSTSPDRKPAYILRLRGSARDRARSVLSNFTDDDGLVTACMDAGTAVEHLAKAYLASLHPTLILDTRFHLDSALHLTGHSNLAKTPLTDIRTVGAHEACLRVKHVLPTFKYAEEDQRVFVSRNASTHLALATQESAREAARTMVRLIEPLLEALELDRLKFWGPLVATADNLLDETVNELKAIVEAKFTAARQRLAERLAGLDAAGRSAVLGAISGKSYASVDHDEEWECPVCGQQGWLACAVEDVGSPDVEYEQTGPEDFEFVGAWIDCVAYPVIFECSACGLELEGRELELTDAPSEVDMEPRELSTSELMAYDGER